MRRIYKFLIPFVITLVVWIIFSWPLPKYTFSGISSSDRNLEKDNVRTMIAGDHLQLLYHFWLAGDMIAGHTPWFYNLYEFNEGDDEARRVLSPLYIPFSLFQVIGEKIGGRAFGWYFSGFISAPGLRSKACFRRTLKTGHV